jgi:hypothetical protein
MLVLAAKVMEEFLMRKAVQEGGLIPQIPYKVFSEG